MMSGDSPKERTLKRKATDDLNEKGWKLMHNMGYEKGKGLGKEAQGIIEPVDVSKQKGRRGLGLVPKSEIGARPTGELYRSSDPRLVWIKDADAASADADKIWYWRPKPDLVSDAELSTDFLGPPDSLCSLFLQPTDPRAVGPPIQEMSDQFKFCSQQLVKELLTYKNQLDNLSNMVVTDSHQRCNPYEQIKKGIFMNRAAMKLANMDAIFHGLLTNAAAKDDVLYFADVCAGPGGFSEYLLWRRCNAVPLRSTTPDDEDYGAETKAQNVSDPSFTRDPILSSIPHLNAKGFGLTLTGNCDFRETDFLAGPPEAFLAHYGAEHNGDITSWANLASFSALIHQATNGQGVHILVADGGFDVSAQHNLQEVLSKRIYLCQCLCALMVLRPGGHFITKLFDVFTEFSVGLIYLVGQMFEEVAIVKPVTSRPANSERYLLCKRLLSPVQGMAGCAQRSTSADHPIKSSEVSSVSTSELPEPRHKARRKPRLDCATPVGRTENTRQFGVLDRDKTGALGELIEYFLSVNEAIGAFSNTGATKTDVLRLCLIDTLVRDETFYKFIKQMNEEFAIHQCVALSKLLTFAHDPLLNDLRQAETKEMCLKRWKISLAERIPVPWPLMTSNRSAVIHELLGDKEKLKSLNALPSTYGLESKVELFTGVHLSNLEFLLDSQITIVCGRPSKTSGQVPTKPMLFYSRGSRIRDIHVTLDGNEWTRLDQLVPLLKPRLPAGTLVLGQSTMEYTVKNGLRVHALVILDVVCIYGQDCRNLSYRKRMELAQRMCDVVNFPGMRESYIRVPPMLSLRELPNFMKKLDLMSCKDATGNVPMYRHPDGTIFQPSLVFLVKHLAEPWVEAVSRSTGKVYYFNPKTSESTFSISADQHLSFLKTHFTEVTCTADRTDAVTVSQLVNGVSNLCRILADNC